MVTCSKLPSEDGSVISNESEKLNSGRGLTVPKVTAQQKLTKEGTRKRDGESRTLMQIIIINILRLLCRQGQMCHICQKYFPVPSCMRHFSFQFSCTQVLIREMHCHCSFFFFYSQRGCHSAVSRDGPDEYAWDRHSADMIQYGIVAVAVAETHTHAHILWCQNNENIQRDPMNPHILCSCGTPSSLSRSPSFFFCCSLQLNVPHVVGVS